MVWSTENGNVSSKTSINEHDVFPYILQRFDTEIVPMVKRFSDKGLRDVPVVQISDSITNISLRVFKKN